MSILFNQDNNIMIVEENFTKILTIFFLLTLILTTYRVRAFMRDCLPTFWKSVNFCVAILQCNTMPKLF